MKLNNKLILTSILALNLTACGGGGGGGSSTAVVDTPQNIEPNENVTEVNEFAPNGELLMSEAQESGELYVEENFSFTSSNQVSLQITASNGMEPMGYTRVSVYLVPSQLENWNDENLEDAQLIGSGVTNATGLFQRIFDVPQYDSQFLVVLNTVGIENKALIAIDGESLSYHFH